MPASPRATVVGLGLATAIIAAIFLVPAMVLTGYFGSLGRRGLVREQSVAAIDRLRLVGVETDALPPARPLPIDGLSLLPVTGTLTAFDGQHIPLHKQPAGTIALVGATARRQALTAADFDGKETPLEEIVGSTGGRGVPVAFADGTVWLLRESTPCGAVRPFLTRNTLVKLRRDEWLAPFRLKERQYD